MASNILLQKIKDVESDSNDYDYSPPVIKSSSGKSYYAKAGSVSEQEQYSGEIESLNHIERAAPGLAPRVLASGTDETGRPYCISEYKDVTRLTTLTAMKLATRLAGELHVFESDSGFGFGIPTFCGLTRLKNGWHDTWEECYNELIGGLLEGLVKISGNEELCEKGNIVRKTVIPHLLRPLKVKPVLLHGDLWSGNAGTDTKTNEAVIYDPASFYGHNEFDLAIARIFGGFPPSFFSEYHKVIPKSEPENQYELRVDLYELFHYLNHALIFGGSSYAASAVQKMDRLLKYCH